MRGSMGARPSSIDDVLHAAFSVEGMRHVHEVVYLHLAFSLCSETS